MLFTQKTCRKAAIVGLGGVGKTPGGPADGILGEEAPAGVLHLLGVGAEWNDFEQAYAEMARILPLGNVGADEDPKEPIRRYLSSEAAGPWLLVVDNADDMDTVFGSPGGRGGRGGLNKYLPESEDGVVLFTTRSRQVAVSAARGDVVELLEMDPARRLTTCESR